MLSLNDEVFICCTSGLQLQDLNPSTLFIHAISSPFHVVLSHLPTQLGLCWSLWFSPYVPGTLASVSLSLSGNRSPAG